MERLSPHLQKVQDINCAITKRRNQFIAEYQNPHQGKRALTYEPALDREVYKVLKKFQHDGEQHAYIHARNELNAYTEFQVETFIGERLHVGLSSFRYDLRDGQMYGHNMSESLLAMIERGRQCRDFVVKDIDKPRQEAEIVQFQRIQDEFTKPDKEGNQPEVGKTIISISPPGGEGSAYAHNFYDVFILSEDKDTKERYVAAHRYASELSPEEYEAKAETLVPGYMDEYTNGSVDSYFLSRPLVLDIKSPLSGRPDAIHAEFHTGKDFLSSEDFGEIRRSIAGLITSYVNTLVDSPSDEDFLNLTLNAIMNKADDVAGSIRRGQHVSTPVHTEHHTHGAQTHAVGPVSRSEITALGSKPVRAASTGCGESSGFGTGTGENKQASNMSSFSSGDFGKDSLGSRTFNCPECGQKNVRPYNETIPSCQHCGSEKVAC